MLLHSRGQKGEMEKTRLNALLEEFATIAYQGTRAADPNVSVDLVKNFDDSIGEIDAVPQDLSRVVINIVNNACYAAMEKGKRLGSDFKPVITVATKRLDKTAEVRIRDNGDGIPDEIREKIFQPFFTTKPTGKGTGLGLSITYDIVVQEHHGSMRVETEPGEFTEFVIELPLP
jgi:signal transduction histidine kinase